MSQGFSETQLTPPPRNRKAGILIAGTVLAVLGAGIALQVARAKPGQSAVDPQAGRTQLTDGAREMARVNGQKVTYSEVAKECMERHGKEILENLINRKLIQHACAQKGVKVSQEEVLQEIVRISKRFGLEQGTWYKMLQAERGLTPIQYQRDVIWPMLALKKLAGTEVRVTREMMQKAYADAYGQKANCKMIVLDNMRHAQEVAGKVRQAPQDFERLAQEHSVEPNSKSLGGTIPPIRRYSGAHEKVRAAAFSMRQPGEISSIIQVGLSSYVILKFEGFTKKIEHNPNDVKEQLHEELVEQETQKMVAQTFQKLRDNAQILNRLTGESTTTMQPVSATGAGRKPVHSADYQPAGRQPRPQQRR